MKILVTGGAGFVARHLTAELMSAGHEVWLSDRFDAPLSNYRKADLADVEAVYNLVASVKPEAIIHLGAISFVPDAAKDTRLLQRVNVDATHDLIAAFLDQALPRRDCDMPRFLFASTAQIYLDNPSAYALSKMSGEAIVRHFNEEGLDGVIARPANHTGPGQSEKFVVPSFVRQALDIKAGRRRMFTVGNLDSVRDFTDVRDVARAYRLMLEKGASGCTYQVGSSERLTMRELLYKVAGAVGVPTDHEVDKAFWRPTDESPRLNTEAIRGLGWQPSFTLDQTIEDMIKVMR